MRKAMSQAETQESSYHGWDLAGTNPQLWNDLELTKIKYWHLNI